MKTRQSRTGRASAASARKPQSASRTSEAAARREVVATAVAMSRVGLSPGRSGNVSRRWRNGMLITPSGMAYETMTPADIVFVAGDGTVPPRQSRAPSSEWRFHLAAYMARADMHAVVHTHSMHAVILAAARKSIPAFHYMVAVAGGNDIPCIPYATFGTGELADLVAEGLKHRNACLMSNHGQIALGATLAAALDLAAEVEILAEQYYKVLTIGRPHLLDDAEMANVLQRFQRYGQKAQE
jgi:L-fuculose-phosphate aldolase